MYSQFCQQKWLKWKNHDFFSILGHFLTKNAFLSTSSDIMPILLECSKILNAYILSHKDMTFSNISCWLQLCWSKIAQWDSHWNVENLGFLKLLYFDSKISYIIFIYIFRMFMTWASKRNKREVSIFISFEIMNV